MSNDTTEAVTPPIDLEPKFFARIVLLESEARSFVLSRLWRGLQHYGLTTANAYASVDDLRQWVGGEDFCEESLWHTLLADMEKSGLVECVRKQFPESQESATIFWLRPVQKD